MIKNSINIDAAIELLRKRKTTVDDLCKFIYDDIMVYQDSREEFYFEEFKNEFCYDEDATREEVADRHAEAIIQKIEKDVKSFTKKYVDSSIDCVLDAINEKRFKTKKSSDILLSLLSSLKEINEET